MNRFEPRAAVGGLLVAGGVLFLLQNLAIVPSSLAWVWAGVFAAAGIGFLWFFWANRSAWWPLIPGLALLDVAMLIGLGAAWPAAAARWGGALFLWSLALPFAGIYLVNRAQWWSLIPAGVLATLGGLASLDPEAQGPASGGLFFLGLGLTFLLVWLAPAPEGRRRWAIWPALPLLVLGGVLITPFAALGTVVFPVVLVAAGAVLLYRALRPAAR